MAELREHVPGPSGSTAASLLVAGIAVSSTGALATVFHLRGANLTSIISFTLVVLICQVASITAAFALNARLPRPTFRAEAFMLSLVALAGGGVYALLSGVEQLSATWFLCVLVVTLLICLQGQQVAMRRGARIFGAMAWTIILGASCVSWFRVGVYASDHWVAKRTSEALQQQREERIAAEKLYRTSDEGQLEDAVKAGDLAQVEELLSRDVSLSGAPERLPPLYHAVEVKNFDIARLLLESGADPNGSPKRHANLVALALNHDDPDTARLLIQHGAAVNPPLPIGETLLALAARHGVLPIVKEVLETQNEPHVARQYGPEPLEAALNHGHWLVGLYLLEQGFRLDDREQASQALRRALLASESEVAKRLIRHGVNLGAAGTADSPLMLAIMHCDDEVIRLLLASSPDLGESWTGPELSRAAHLGRLEAVKLLIDAGADVNEKPTHGATPLESAMYASHVDCAVLLIERGAKADSLLLRDIYHDGDPRVVQALLENGADANYRFVQYSDNATPLHRAAEGGNVQIAKLLVQHGGEIDAECKLDNWTPLFLAIRSKKVEMVRFLVESGANVEFASRSGKTPAELAIQINSGEISEILRQSMDDD